MIRCLLKKNVDPLWRALLVPFTTLDALREFTEETNRISEVSYKLQLITLLSRDPDFLSAQSEVETIKPNGKSGRIDLFMKSQHCQMLFEVKQLGIQDTCVNANSNTNTNTNINNQRYESAQHYREAVASNIRSIQRQDMVAFSARICSPVTGTQQSETEGSENGMTLETLLEQIHIRQTVPYYQGLVFTNHYSGHLDTSLPTILITVLFIVGNSAWKVQVMAPLNS